MLIDLSATVPLDLLAELTRARTPCLSQPWEKVAPLIDCLETVDRPVLDRAGLDPARRAAVDASYARERHEAEAFDNGKLDAPAFVARMEQLDAESLAALGLPPPVLTPPDWAIKPSGRTVAKFYPPEARKAKLEGGALLQCSVALSGEARHCKVLSEAPPGRGFSQAALAIVGQAKFKPATINGTPMEGAPINIPFVFAISNSVDWVAVLTAGAVSAGVSAATGGLAGVVAGIAAGTAAGAAVQASPPPAPTR